MVTGRSLGVAVLCVAAALVQAGTEVLRPRGVPLVRASMYDASKPFTCFDGSNQVPFGYVNDDYCDCHDGSDEPGTAACAQGFFHCANRGFRSLDIPSSRVNDGICDCCDGTDEFDNKVVCPNECMEMGKQMREEAEKEMIALRLGFEKRQKYIETVKTKKSEKTRTLDTLEAQLKELEGQKEALTEAREKAEVPEKVAVEKHKEIWENMKKERENLLEKIHAEEAFKAISNAPHILSSENLLAKLGKEGETLNEEIHEAIHRLSDITVEDFTRDLWPKIKNVYRKLQDVPTPAPPAGDVHTPAPPTGDVHTKVAPPAGDSHTGSDEATTAAPSSAGGVHSDDEHLEDYEKEFDEDHHEDDHHDEEKDHRYNRHDETEAEAEAEAEEKMPEYDAETKVLVEAAEKARQELREFEKRLSDLEKERDAAKRWLENDYGPDSVFAALEGECFEYTDREYTYKVCPFDKVVQRPKDGGSDTGLGKWGSWEENYTVMYFNDGARCWNGPARSTKVFLQCGGENELGSAIEPSRCEYQMTFRTPAVCAVPPQNISAHLGLHDEL